MHLLLSLAVTTLLSGVIAYPGHVDTRDLSYSNLACDGAELDGYCCAGSIIIPAAQTILYHHDNADLSDLVCCMGDSSHNIGTSSDSPITCSRGSAMPLTQCPFVTGTNTPASETQYPISRPAGHVFLSANWKNASSISDSREEASPGIGLAVLRIMCHTSRKIVGIGSAMVLGFGGI